MQIKFAVSDLDSLLHRLAVVNARIHELTDEEGNLLSERREIMELITRERLGQAKRTTWTPDDGYTS